MLRAGAVHGSTEERPRGARLMMLEWHITRRCNLSCHHCYIDYLTPIQELSDDECTSLLDTLVAMGVPGIIFSGGEPLLRAELLLRLIAECSRCGVRSVLATNGVLLDQRMLGRLKDAGLYMVGISIDSAEAARHDRFRGVEGSFEASARAIAVCAENGMPVQVQTVASKQNKDEVAAVTELCRRWGVTKHLVLDFVPCGRAASEAALVLDRSEREALLDLIYEESRSDNGLTVEYIEPYWQRKICQMEPERGAELRRRFFQGGTCMGGNAFAAIMPGGDVLPCPRLQVVAGNVREQDFADIWRDAPVFGAMRDPQSLGGKCPTCTQRDLCDGCRARALLHSGDLLGPDPCCIGYEEKD